MAPGRTAGSMYMPRDDSESLRVEPIGRYEVKRMKRNVENRSTSFALSLHLVCVPS